MQLFSRSKWSLCPSLLTNVLRVACKNFLIDCVQVSMAITNLVLNTVVQLPRKLTIAKFLSADLSKALHLWIYTWYSHSIPVHWGLSTLGETVYNRRDSAYKLTVPKPRTVHTYTWMIVNCTHGLSWNNFLESLRSTTDLFGFKMSLESLNTFFVSSKWWILLAHVTFLNNYMYT